MTRKGLQEHHARDNSKQRHTATEQPAAPPGPVLQFVTLHGPCGTRHIRQAEACAKAFPGDTQGPDLRPQEGMKLPAKSCSFSQTPPRPRRQQSSASLGAGRQAGISSSLLIASGAQEQGTQQQIACEVRLHASWSGYRCSAAGDASQHALSMSSTHAKCHG